MRAIVRRMVMMIALGATNVFAQGTPAYRQRILGVFDAQSGEPLEGAEVGDLLAKLTALTTKTGTVSLVFLPEGETLIRIRKVGYQPTTMVVMISPADTVPITVTLSAAAQTLPTVVTRDSARHYISPGLREFEERRRAGLGHYFTDSLLRRYDSDKMANLLRRLPGVVVNCGRGGCRASSVRASSLGGGCPMKIYVDGIVSSETNLDMYPVNEYSGIEYYAGTATVPAQYGGTGASCGVLLFWSREK